MNDKAAASSVKAAVRTLDVFEAFRASGEPLSLTELAERIDCPVSSCHALVKTLQGRGYVYSLDQRRRIYPTRRLLEIATDIDANDPLLPHLVPLMTGLRDITGETVILGKAQRDEVIYLDVIEGTHTIRYNERPGAAKPLHSSAIGKAMLSQRSRAELLAFVGRGLEARTANTITDPETLVADLNQGREQGYFVTRGENVADVMAIAIAVKVAGETLGFALAGPIERMRRNWDQNLAEIDAFRARVNVLASSI